MSIKSHIKKGIGVLKKTTGFGFSSLSFSQDGEDMILKSVFSEKKTPGFYIDVGAFHPVRFSNTCYFYRKGWRGINIDARPGGMRLFNLLRPRDINIEAAVSSQPKRLNYHIFDEPAINTFDAKFASGIIESGQYRLISTKEITSRTLAEILNEFLPCAQPIDFLNIDAEGLDLDVLKSNDFSKFRPKIILIEDLSLNLTNTNASPTNNFLEENGYEIFLKTVRSAFFINKV